MTAALLGLLFIVLIALLAVALGSLTRLIAARIVTPPEEHERLSVAERIGRGNALIARELRPDGTHPVARTAERTDGAAAEPGREPRQDLAVRFPEIAAHSLR
mgnify:CR=1 FL=1